MADQVFTNPLGAFRDVDYTRGRYNDTPQQIIPGASIWSYQNAIDIHRNVCWDFTLITGANATLEGSPMVLIPPTTASTPPTVRAFIAGTDSDFLIIGISLANGVIGKKLPILMRGIGHVQYHPNPSAAGQLGVIAGATTNGLEFIAPGTVSAATVQGSLHSVTISATGESAGPGSQSLVWSWFYGNPV